MAGKEFTSPQVETYLLFKVAPAIWQINEHHRAEFVLKQYNNPYTNTPALLLAWHTTLSRGDKIKIGFRPRQSFTPNPDQQAHPLSTLFPSDIVVRQTVSEFYPADNMVRIYGLCGPLCNEVMTDQLLIELGKLEAYYGYGDTQVRLDELLPKMQVFL